MNNDTFDPSIMEARNFIAAREMIEHGNWLLPTMNGSPRLAKPPLPTWITALSALAAGNLDNLVALRFPAALMATIMVLILFYFARDLTADALTPFWSAAVLATSLYIIIMARQGTWDIYAHAFMLGAIWCLYRGLRPAAGTLPSFLLAGALMGLSFLSKGPVALYAMLLPFLLSYGYAFGVGTIKARWKAMLVAVALAVVIGAVWPLYAWLQEPQAWALAVHTEASSWVERHTRPFWHYWSFPLQSGLWVLFAVAALIVPYARPRVDAYGNYRFLAAWVLSAVVLLSLVPEKKERYLMPVLVPMALLVGAYLRALMAAYDSRSPGPWDRIVVKTNGCVFALLGFAAPVFLFALADKAATGLKVMASLGFVGLGIAMVFLVNKQRLVAFFAVMIAMMCLVPLLIMPVIPDLIYTNTHYTDLRRVREIEAVHTVKLYALDALRPEHLWSIGKRVTILKTPGKELQLPEMPALLFSRQPLAERMNVDASLHVQLLGVYPYHRRDPGKTYYLYRVSPAS